VSSRSSSAQAASRFCSWTRRSSMNSPIRASRSPSRPTAPACRPAASTGSA
jgi:hypothetical protein